MALKIMASLSILFLHNFHVFLFLLEEKILRKFAHQVILNLKVRSPLGSVGGKQVEDIRRQGYFAITASCYYLQTAILSFLFIFGTPVFGAGLFLPEKGAFPQREPQYLPLDLTPPSDTASKE